uniref:PX domain-containing protein n=1 Tax=Hucho hucho TaxID=62062 RepID=A0A4W5L3V8_9TELE
SPKNNTCVTVPVLLELNVYVSVYLCEYIIRVQRGVSTENSWQVNKNLIYKFVSGVSLPLPPKKLLGNMDREFIAERQRGLQVYLDFITQHHILATCQLVKKFLDANNYSANYTGVC